MLKNKACRVCKELLLKTNIKLPSSVTLGMNLYKYVRKIEKGENET